MQRSSSKLGAIRHRPNRSAKSQLLALAFGSTYGQYVVLLFCAIVLVIVGALFWTLLAQGVSDYDTSWRAAIWLSWGIFFDPGTQTGLSYEDGEVDKSLVVIFSILGFLFNLVFLGVIVDNIRNVLDRFYVRYAEISAVGHVVILGWTPRTLFLVNEVMALFEDQNVSGEIVVVGNRDRYHMQRAVELAFRRRQPPVPRNVRIRCWQGDTAEEDDLTRLSLSGARFVIALSESNDPRVADAQSIETILALQSLELEEQCRGPILAELRTKDAVEVVRQINADSASDVLGINCSRLVDMIIGLTMLRPTVGRALVQLTSFFGNDFMFVAVEAEHEGLTFGQVHSKFPRAIVAGLREPKKSPVLAPPVNTPLKRGDLLLVIALDHTQTRVRPPADHALTSSAPSPQPAPHPQSARAPITEAGARSGPPSATTAVNSADTSTRPSVIIIGWRTAREMAALVRSMSQLLGPSAQITILSQQDAALREEKLEAELLALREKGEIVYVKHVAGSPMSTKVLHRLPLRSASVALVVADQPSSGMDSDAEVHYADGDARLDDARIWAVTTLLRSSAPELPIVAAFSHIMTYRLLSRDATGPVGDHLITKVVHRNALEVGLLAMQASDPTLALVYKELLSKPAVAQHRIFSLSIREAQGMLKLGSGAVTASFDNLADKMLRTRGHVLCGYMSRQASSTGDPVINPEDKTTPITWGPDDELLLLRQAGTLAPSQD